MPGPRPPKKLDSDGLWNFALRALAGRPHSAGELRQKLLRRAANPSEIADVMTKLGEYNLTDDRKFSESFASLRLQNEGFGQARVVRDLRARRITGDVAAQAVAKTFAGTDETELAERFLLRKYRGKNLPELLREEKHLAAAYRRLRLGGFSSPASLTVLKRYSRRVEDWDEPAEEPDR